MSKARRKIPIFVKALAVILIIIGLLLAIATIHQRQTKERINNNYQTFRLPQQLTLQSASWYAGNIDSLPTWTYTYAVTGERSEVFNALKTNLKEAGYSIDSAPNPTEDSISAHDTKNKLQLSVGLLPVAATNLSTAPPLQSVNISAEEIPR